MRTMYTRIHSIVRRDKYMMLYLDRPNGYMINAMSLYEIQHEHNKIVVPIANGNNVRAMKFIAPKNRSTYWLSKLTERDMLQVRAEPVYTIKAFEPMASDVFLCCNEGVSHFLSYFTNGEFITPSKLIIQNKSINDCFEFSMLHNIMNKNLQVHITERVPKAQYDTIMASENLKNIVHFKPVDVSKLAGSHAWVSGAPMNMIHALQQHGISHQVLPTFIT